MRFTIPTPEMAPVAARPMLDAVHNQFGVVPNLFRLVAQSPAALEGLTGLSGALRKTLDAKTRERIAIAVAQANGCDYCLSAHSYIALNLAHLDAAEIALNRKGASSDPKAGVALRFALQVLETRGKVADADLATVRAAGFSDAEILDIVGHVALNVLTNFYNNVAKTEIDFPAVADADAA
ncbi:peroxidase-related enzyme [Rhodoblastus sp. 17X3]|uniref:carboxymuconolactone decarboxylase family protein n=1 Tax=Rhodoblastus sp. 17X3 TaxID=3047026 RepID=UPI0024B6B173|nr:peroxidase-related enzyme [Rhodoblastus sp. 17X3]MDI9848897.1 peroxidase-related enzyme [Rhodoblastus sp. 17X3]